MRGLQQSQDGYLRLDNQQSLKLLSTEPIEKYFHLEEEPFARGKYAAVRRCVERSTGWEYAAKTVKKRSSKDPAGREEVLHEVAVLEACQPCSRIVGLHRVFESPQEFVIILELGRGGELQTLLDSEDELPCEKQVQELMAQIIEGIGFLHKINVAHLDIKPQNLILMGEFPGCEVKLCDLGISRHISQGADVREILGTPDYVAPEVLNYEPISLATDMWSVGVLLYVLLSGCSPFGGDSKQETFCNISQCRLDFPEDLFAEISPEAKDLITKLVVKSPSGRLTAEQCKNHPWFARKFSESSTPLCSPVPSMPVCETRTPIVVQQSIITEEKLKPQVICNFPLKPEIKNCEDENKLNNNNKENNNSLQSIRGLSEERRKSLQSNLASLIQRLETEEPVVSRRAERSDSLKRAAGMQTMPAIRFREPEMYKCQRVLIVDEDEGLPPSIASSSADSSSVSDSASDRSSIISLDDGLDYPARLRHSTSCLNVCERRPNQSFAAALSKFRDGETVKLRSREDRSRFRLFDSNRLSLPPPPPPSRKSVGLEFVREGDGNLVVIREVKAVQGKKYSRTSELKCETVQSRIRKLQQIKSDKLQNSVF